MRLVLADLAATAALGTAIAVRLRAGDVVALSGTLGAGKTTLARAILAALGHGGEVPSPSFAIIETYAPPAVRLPLVHADFYRLADPAEVAEIGLDDYREGAAMIAEWPEHAGGFGAEPGCLAIRLEPLGAYCETGQRALSGQNDGAGRIAIVEGGADWLGRMPMTSSSSQ